MSALSDTKLAVAAVLAALPILSDTSVLADDTTVATKLEELVQRASGLAVVVAIPSGDVDGSRRALARPALDSPISVTIWCNPLLLNFDETGARAAESPPYDQAPRNPEDILEACLVALHNFALSVDRPGDRCSKHTLDISSWETLTIDSTMIVYEITLNTTIHI